MSHRGVGAAVRRAPFLAPPPPPPAGTPPPATAPIASERSMRLLRGRLRLGRHHRIRVPLRCSAGAEEGCRGTLRLYAKRRHRNKLRRIGERKRFVLEAGESRRVKVRIGRRGRRLLASRRRPTVVARVRYESVAGAMRTVERRYRLRG